ncbi:hypothetical protein [Proteus phage PM 116]|uniref:Uncharacterized protein n=1 Tax=Proteus phage PM 116 TaxID=1837877 RepID=A0A2D0VK69_9CAUD|nr:hypothetical protein HOS11_gp03 [Proteus phage PM 116]ANU80085.1 hypothetical protein [Proteus phage PM 116]
MFYEIYLSDYASFKLLSSWCEAESRTYNLNGDQEMYVVKIERMYSEQTLRELLVENGIEFDDVIPFKMF